VFRRTNSFLDQYNETLFKPRGLFCMIMMYDPVANADMERHPGVATQPNSGEISGWKQQLNKRDPFYTDPEAASRLPFVVAPLVYHNTEVENDADSDEGKPASGGSKVKNAFSRFEKYLDRRAQAQYVSSPLPPPHIHTHATHIVSLNHTQPRGCYLHSGLLS